MLNIIQRHLYHLADLSLWPFAVGISVLITMSGFVIYMHCYQMGSYVAIIGFFTLVCVVFIWWRGIIRESTFQGHHTKGVYTGLRWGMFLFIVSEIMFFSTFFWFFFVRDS